ncbi:plasmid SOS inhibition protein A (plasmid) [Escherichia coli]|nr:plasmid SOS inhibition protein A [Escherichia coli]
MSARSQALVPLSAEQQAAWRAVAETEKRRHQGNTLAEYPYAGGVFPLSERKPQDIAV